MVHVFIVNPVAGFIDKTEYIKNVLSKRDDIQYIVFTTEEAGHEYYLMKEMVEIFDDEDVRIYICGGSGTLSNALDALTEEDFDHVEIGYYPCGLTNDFLKNFGNDKKKFEDLNAVIDGKVRNIDFVRCYNQNDEKPVKNNLLFSTMGIPAQIQDLANVFSSIGRMKPTILYSICSLCSIPICGAIDYDIDVDGVDYSGEYRLVYVGNSVCLGGGYFPIRSNISCQDGVINMLFLKKFPVRSFFKYLMGFMHGTLSENTDKYCLTTSGRRIRISRADRKQMTINSDGEIHKDTLWDMEVVHNRLKFIVPRDAEFSKDFEEMKNYEVREEE